MTSSTTTITQFETDSTRYYHRNFASGFIHGIFFQLSAAFTSIHTVLPAFVTLLTPSAMAVGLMAAVQGIGQVIPHRVGHYH